MILVLGLSLVIGGCETIPMEALPQTEELVEPEISVNPALVQAESDLARVQALGGEWLIRVPGIDRQPVPLSQIMQVALRFHEYGNAAQATKYAQIVSRFAQLGILQAWRQRDAKPFYPQ